MFAFTASGSVMASPSWAGLLLILILLLGPKTADSSLAAPTKAEVERQIQHLGSRDEKVRLQALDWVIRNPTGAAPANPAIERLIREDKVREVRIRALLALSTIALFQEKPCPMLILETIFDKDEEVGACAVHNSFFKTYPPGATEIFLRCARSKNAVIREQTLHSLVLAGGKDKRVREALERAKKDPVFFIRYNAEWSSFQLDDDLASYLGYLIRVRYDPEGVLGPIDRNSAEGKRAVTTRNLIALGSDSLTADWGEKRADEFAAALLKYLKDPSPLLRWGAAREIGLASVKRDPADFALDKLLGDKAKTQKKPVRPLQKSRVALRLDQLGVQERLRQLSNNDPDATVRAVAGFALERFTAVMRGHLKE